MIVKDEALLDTYRSRTQCQWCSVRTQGCDPHHCHAKGIGGGSRLDIPENIIALCRRCHGHAHSGKIDKANLLARLAWHLGKTPEECQQVIWDTLAKKK